MRRQYKIEQELCKTTIVQSWYVNIELEMSITFSLVRISDLKMHDQVVGPLIHKNKRCNLRKLFYEKENCEENVIFILCCEMV